MFHKCTSLVEFANFEINKNEIEENSIGEDKYLYSEEINKYNNFYPNNLEEDIINQNSNNSSNKSYFSLLENIDVFKTKTNAHTYLKRIEYIFSYCSSLMTLPDISKWNTNNVKDMSHIFDGYSSLISLPDISKWNTNNVNNMRHMFDGCSSLISLPDISKWNSNNVKDMSYMFRGCSSLISLPDLSKWNTNNVKDMSYMFYGCNSLPLKFIINN